MIYAPRRAGFRARKWLVNCAPASYRRCARSLTSDIAGEFIARLCYTPQTCTYLCGRSREFPASAQLYLASLKLRFLHTGHRSSISEINFPTLTDNFVQLASLERSSRSSAWHNAAISKMKTYPVLETSERPSLSPALLLSQFFPPSQHVIALIKHLTIIFRPVIFQPAAAAADNDSCRADNPRQPRVRWRTRC